MGKAKAFTVTTKTSYISDQSDPDHDKFVWSYEITIESGAEEIVQLLNRFWRITDLTGHVEEIRGHGVIGLQPLIKPGKTFVYTSFCQLMTPQGTMEGHYEMQNLDEVHFNVPVPKFILSAPTSITKIYRSRLH